MRSLLWEHLITLRSSIGNPWTLLGDFNEILLPSEVRGGSFSLARANSFANVLENCNLTDLGFMGSPFTWHRNSQGLSRMSKRLMLKRLDRILAACNWRTTFTEAMIEHLCRFRSDHNPILLRCGGIPTPLPIGPLDLKLPILYVLIIMLLFLKPRQKGIIVFLRARLKLKKIIYFSIMLFLETFLKESDILKLD